MTASLLKSPNILADLNNAVVWIVSSRPLISKSSSPCTNLVVTIKSTDYNWYQRHIHVQHSLLFPSKVLVLIFILALFQFCGQPGLFGRFSFLLIIISSGRLAEIAWSVCISKSLRSLCVPEGYAVVHIPFLRQVKFKLLEQFPVDHLAHPVVSILIIFL